MRDVSGLAGVPRVAASELCVEAGDVPLPLEGEGVLHGDLGGARVAVVVPGVEDVARGLDTKRVFLGCVILPLVTWTNHTSLIEVYSTGNRVTQQPRTWVCLTLIFAVPLVGIRE